MVDFMAVLGTIGNWLVIIVIVYIAGRIYARMERRIISEVMEEYLKKMEEKITIQNALRNIKR
jgi:hypothetical protein